VTAPLAPRRLDRRLAPAKLTVSLRVTGVRPDGYHEIDAEMVTLDLADELEFDAGGTELHVQAGTAVSVDGLPPPEGNLVTRALRACGRSAGVRLTKRIPLGGGLGGGSADAAAVLRWAGCVDPLVALGLGSDVPFCVTGGRARVQGVGERVTPLAYEPRDFLLLLPPFGVDTGRVYRAWDQRPSDAAPNALVEAALAVEPRLALWRDALADLSGSEPVLAGSGSTWFVEETSAARGDPWWGEVRLGDHVGRLVRARTVPGGWDDGGPEERVSGEQGIPEGGAG
jgi:4-diphosphocytidyl-2-C-methyl-D-erythritol kinase